MLALPFRQTGSEFAAHRCAADCGFATIRVYNLVMEKQTIILTGFMGTGKTTVGQLLAAKLGYEFVDTDAMIEAQDGRAVAAIFAEDGEASFRQMEANVAQTLAGRRGLVVATGGRMMLDEQNAAALAAAGPVFCLTADPQIILDRLENDGGQRPLLIAPDPARRISDLLAERSAGYGRFPQIDTSGKSAAEVAEEVSAAAGPPGADGCLPARPLQCSRGRGIAGRFEAPR